MNIILQLESELRRDCTDLLWKVVMTRHGLEFLNNYSITAGCALQRAAKLSSLHHMRTMLAAGVSMKPFHLSTIIKYGIAESARVALASGVTPSPPVASWYSAVTPSGPQVVAMCVALFPLALMRCYFKQCSMRFLTGIGAELGPMCDVVEVYVEYWTRDWLRHGEEAIADIKDMLALGHSTYLTDTGKDPIDTALNACEVDPTTQQSIVEVLRSEKRVRMRELMPGAGLGIPPAAADDVLHWIV